MKTIESFLSEESIASLRGQLGNKLCMASTPSVDVNLVSDSVQTGPLSLHTRSKTEAHEFLTIWMKHMETASLIDYQLLTVRLMPEPQGMKFGITKNALPGFLERRCGIRTGELVPLQRVGVYAKSVADQGFHVVYDHAIAFFRADETAFLIAGSANVFHFLDVKTINTGDVDSEPILSSCELRLELS